MDRRGFLGVLAALPVVAKMKIIKEEQMLDIAPNIPPLAVVSKSGEINHCYERPDWCYGSGTLPMCSG